MTEYIYQVQQFERLCWRSKFETKDLDLAYQEAKQRSIITRECVRVIRIETYELTTFYYG